MVSIENEALLLRISKLARELDKELENAGFIANNAMREAVATLDDAARKNLKEALWHTYLAEKEI